MVTFPMEGTKIEALSLTSGPKFYTTLVPFMLANLQGGRTFSLEKFTQTAPSLKRPVSNLYFSPGTPVITTSHNGATSLVDHPSKSTTSCVLFFNPSPRVNFCTPVTSTL